MRASTVNVGFPGRSRGFGAPRDSSESRDMVTSAVRRILVRDYRGLSFEKLFSNVYKTVMDGGDVVLYEDIKGILETHMRDVVLRQLQRAADDGTLLRATCDAYQGIRNVTQMVGDILMFLFNSTRKPKLESIETVQHALFTRLVLRNARVADTLKRLVVDVMVRARADSTKTFELHDVCAVLLRVGEAAAPRRVYEVLAEQPYLHNCEEHCTLLASETLAAHSCKECLATFDAFIEAEVQRARELMDAGTAERVRRRAHTVLIELHVDDLLHMRNNDGLFAMLAAQDLGGLALVHKLIGAGPGGAPRLAREIGQYTEETCVAHQRALLATAGDEFTREQGIAVVDKILGTQRDVASVLHLCFDDSKEMVLAAADGVRRALNAETTLSIARFLSLAVDELVTQRARAMQEADFDAALGELLALFQELRNKDEFEIFYKKHLIARLLQSANRENLALERTLVDRLGALCGRAFAQQVEKTLKDVEEGNRVAHAYADWLQRRALAAVQPFVLEVFTLDHMTLPVCARPCLLPPFVQRAFDTFAQYYTSEVSERRKLALVPTQGDATIRARFPRSAAPVTLSVSTPQMLVLELFNSNPRIAFGTIVDHLGIDERDLRTALVFLSRLHIVMRVKTSATQSKLQKSDELYINPAFTTPKTRLVCFRVAQSDKKVISKETSDLIAKERLLKLNCAITRIMKARKTLSEVNLVTEVVEKVKSRFTPQPHDINRAIEDLIGKEIIVRDETIPKVFHYKP